MRLKQTFLAILIVSSVFSSASAEPIRLAAEEGLMGKFSQSRFLDGFDKPILSEGRFFLLPKTALIWQTVKPFKTQMVVDKDGITQFIAGREVSKLSIARFPALAILRDVLEDSLSGNWGSLEEMTGSKILESANSWQLEFVPASTDEKFPFAALSFEMTDYLDKIEIRNGENDLDVIKFFDQQKASLGLVREAARKSGQAYIE